MLSLCCCQCCTRVQVLSVQTALSIQSHPDKALAERLHSERPKVGSPAVSSCTARLLAGLTSDSLVQDYKDDNHKPEMAVAISDFEALCSFVPMPELTQVSCLDQPGTAA